MLGIKSAISSVMKWTLSEAELAMKLLREYESFMAWNEKNWRRCVANWRMYWGIDNEMGIGQWDPAAAADLLRQDRQVATYNFCRPIVDNIAGGIMKAPFDFTFSPTDDEMTTLSYSIRDLMLIDKELLDWRSHELELVIGGLIYQQVMEMYVSREYNKEYGNIGLRTLQPGAVVFDPKWRSPRSKDCKRCFKTDYLTALQLIDLFKDKEQQIIKSVLFKKFGEKYLEELATLEMYRGEEFGDNMGIIPYPDNEDMWGSLYKVISCYHMEKVKVTYDYVLLEDGGKVRIPKEYSTPEEKIKWLNENQPGWIPDAVFTEDEIEEIQVVTIFCPSLNPGLILANGPTEVQCGRLQFFPWSASRLNGEVGGIIDAIKDAQNTINYWESLITYKIQTEGGGGAQFVDPNDFESEAEYAKYIRNRNNPRAVFRLKRGSLRNKPTGPAVPVQKSPFPHEAMKHLEHMIEVILPRLGKTNPASQGRTEASNESGYLYKLKKLQSDIEKYTIYEGLRNFWNEVGEAYLYQAVPTYGNGIERNLYNPRTKSKLTINKHEIRQDENGDYVEVIVNNIANLREIRHKVMVVEGDSSPTRKMEIMQTSSELLKSVNPNLKPLHYQELSHILTSQLDSFDEEKKERLDEDHELEMAVARQQLKTSYAKMKAEEMLANAQIEQVMAQAAGMLQPQAQGVPQQGANATGNSQGVEPESGPVNPGYSLDEPQVPMSQQVLV